MSPADPTPPAEAIVYVPAPGSRLTHRVAPASAVVATDPGGAGDRDEARTEVDFEGNVYGSASLSRYADRVLHAADRHHARYPTVARAVVSAGELRRVGVYDGIVGEVRLDGDEAAAALAQWLGVAPDALGDQLLTSAVRHQVARQVRELMAHGDPASHEKARHLAREARLPWPS